jgi:hypothetical protein
VTDGPDDNAQADAKPVSIPREIGDDETLHRRIHPTHVKPDGSVSSQAFRDAQMSVDRAAFRATVDTLHGYGGYGISAFIAHFARQHGQTIRADPELLNPAHALVEGTKSKSVARAFARAAVWVVEASDASAG